MDTKRALLVKFSNEDFSKIRQAAGERRIPMATYVRMLVIRQMQLEASGDLHE